MPEYRITYQATVSVSLTLTRDSDDEALTEEASQALVEEHFQSAGFAFGPQHCSLIADASVDGTAPTMIERLDSVGAVLIGGK